VAVAAGRVRRQDALAVDAVEDTVAGVVVVRAGRLGITLRRRAAAVGRRADLALIAGVRAAAVTRLAAAGVAVAADVAVRAGQGVGDRAATHPRHAHVGGAHLAVVAGGRRARGAAGRGVASLGAGARIVVVAVARGAADALAGLAVVADGAGVAVLAIGV